MVVTNAYPGVLHQYTSRLVAFEWASQKKQESSFSDENISTVIFVGGLFDDLLTVPYTPLIAAHLPSDWRLMQARLTSSSFGWGVSSLDRDVKDISKCVAYVRSTRPKGKILLMGHSTGSQDMLHYAVSPLTSDGAERARVDGYILQASCSDREGSPQSPEDLEKAISLARSYVQRGDGEDILPKKSVGFLFPCSANRYLSLVSPGPEHAGQDDMFSSDLDDIRMKELYGRLGETKVPVQFLYSGNDQYVPKFIDKEALVAKWHKIIRDHGGSVHEQSGVVPGMDHTGADASEEVVLSLVSRIVAFAESLR